MTQEYLTSKQKQTVELNQAHGSILVLAIGIDDYDRESGFLPLNTCVYDALQIRDVFQSVWQLNADKERIFTLVSKGKIVPSRGEIIKAINRLASMATEKDRILFYYSGHGCRLKISDVDKFYIVPQDVYSDIDSNALIDFQDIINILNRSEAKQRILIVDACMSGPDVACKKILPAKYSKKFLAEYMKNTTGVVVLSSSRADQSSLTLSPNPKVSLFTYYLLKALYGEPNALDETQMLTISSLYGYISTEVSRRAKSYQQDQLPSIDEKASGVIILGNFGQSIISPESLDWEGYPISKLIFKDHCGFKVSDVLTQIKSWSYTQEYLEQKVNDNLGSYLEKTIGRKVVKLKKEIGFNIGEIGILDTGITFPGGAYDVQYFAEGLKSGRLIESLILDKDWFSRSSDISCLVSCFEMNPDTMILELVKPIIKPESLIPGLEAQGWELSSLTRTKIIVNQSSYELTIEDSLFTLSGFTPNDLFGDKGDKERVKVAFETLALIFSKI